MWLKQIVLLDTARARLPPSPSYALSSTSQGMCLFIEVLHSVAVLLNLGNDAAISITLALIQEVLSIPSLENPLSFPLILFQVQNVLASAAVPLSA